MAFIDLVFARLGYIRTDDMKAKLNFARSVGKRLDEHRETVLAVQTETQLFDDWWHVVHMATQDDYLMRLFHMVHGSWPNEPENHNGESVRARPEILGPCGLPEYRH